MCKLQESVLLDYKKSFPADTLKDISQKTNIQITRIFRIFNGSTMKLTEFEQFQAIIPGKNHSEVAQLALKCAMNLGAYSLELICHEMLHALKLREMNSHKTSLLTTKISA